MSDKKSDINLIDESVFKLIGDDWMLVTSGNINSFNTMTASWGGMGVLWNKPVSYIFIRPTRYTYGFIEKSNTYTLSFFDRKYIRNPDQTRVPEIINRQDLIRFEAAEVARLLAEHPDVVAARPFDEVSVRAGRARLKLPPLSMAALSLKVE